MNKVPKKGINLKYFSFVILLLIIINYCYKSLLSLKGIFAE